jgi:hypothetical protein
MRRIGTLCLGIAATAALSMSGCERECSPAAGGNPAAIVDGAETNFEIWTGVVAVVTDQGLCSGSFIHPRVVLTAGHCVKLYGSDIGEDTYDYTEDASAITVRGGADIGDGDGGFLVGEAESAVVNPDWTGYADDPTAVDLALILLKEPVEDLGYYCVREDPDLEVGDPGVIVGYGLLGSSDPESAGIHRWGETTLLDIGERVIEIGDPTAPCQGDSGGPLFTEVDEDGWQITGVTSFGVTDFCDAMGDAFSAATLGQFDWMDEQVASLTGDSLGDCVSCGPAGFDCATGDDAGADSDSDADGGGETGGGGGTIIMGGGDGGVPAGASASRPGDRGCTCETAGSVPARSMLAALLR